MDPFSHALLGFVLGQAFQLDTNAQLILIISSIILDIDAISIPGWDASFRFHRGPLHSILGAILVSLTLSTVYAVFLRVPARDFMVIGLICLGGSLGHIYLDLLTTGHMAVLWPCSSERVSFDLTHFVDPIVFGVLLLVSVLIFYGKNDIRMIHIITITALAMLTVNFGVRYYERDAAIATIKGPNVYTASKVVPLPTFRPDKWWIAVKTPFGTGYHYEIYSVDSIGHRILSHRTVESPLVDYVNSAEPPIDSSPKAVLYSKRDERVSTFIEKSRLPVANVTLSDDENTWQVFWYDIATQLSEGVSRGINVKVDFDGTVTVNSLAHACV